MRNRKFVVVLTPDEEQPEIFNVTVPALPGCLAWGFGKREALQHIKEVIELFLDSMNESGSEALKSEAVEVEVPA